MWRELSAWHLHVRQHSHPLQTNITTLHHQDKTNSMKWKWRLLKPSKGQCSVTKHIIALITHNTTWVVLPKNDLRPLTQKIKPHKKTVLLCRLYVSNVNRQHVEHHSEAVWKVGRSHSDHRGGVDWTVTEINNKKHTFTLSLSLSVCLITDQPWRWRKLYCWQWKPTRPVRGTFFFLFLFDAASKQQ